MNLDWALVWDNIDVLLLATRLSVMVALAGFGIAVVAGLLLSLARRSYLLPVRWFAFTYVNVFRGSALYVLAIWLWLGVAVAVGWRIQTVVAGILTLALLNSAYMAEVFRAAFAAVDAGQHEAAAAIGLSRVQALRRVIGPQAMRICIPATSNHFVDALKDSAILSVIGIPELMRESARLAQFHQRPFEFYLAAAGIYLVLVYLAAGGFRWLERALDIDSSTRWSRGRQRPAMPATGVPQAPASRVEPMLDGRSTGP